MGMSLRILFIAALLVATISFSMDRAEARHVSSGAATPATLCELLSVAPDSAPSARLVSVTTVAYYDFEHGYFLADNGCQQRDRFSGTGVLRIDLPERATVEAFPELQKLSSQEFLAASVGKRVYCACVGTIDYRDGYPRFVLTGARVWAAN